MRFITMERARDAIFGRRRRVSTEEYDPLTGTEEEDPALEASIPQDTQPEIPFSWTEYCIFGFLGVAMLWAWYVQSPSSSRSSSITILEKSPPQVP